MHSRTWLALGALLGSIPQPSRASTWAIFEDADCQESVNTIIGQNGYPDGVCTNIPEAADQAGGYKGFEFITLDYDCAPTIYQKDITSDSCSGYQIVAEIGKCYNTSWQWYSIDMCSTATGSATTAADTSSPSAGGSSSSSSSGSSIAASAIAGAVVGCVLGLGTIAAVCTYLFWFRPSQQAKRREAREQQEQKEQQEQQRTGGRAGEAEELPGGQKRDRRDSDSPGGAAKAIEMHQLPPELPSPAPPPPPELGGAAAAAEAPGDGGGLELGPAEPRPVELPGDCRHPGYRTSSSARSSHDGEPRDQGLGRCGPGGI